MNILVIKNNVTDQATLDAGLASATQLCSTIGLNLVFTQVTTDTLFNSIPFSNTTNANGHYINPLQIFSVAKSFNIPFDANLLIYDWTKVNGTQCTNPADGGMNMQIPIQWYTELIPNPIYTSAQVLSEFILHELCHLFFAGQNTLPDITHNYDPAFSQLPRDAWYLHLLKQFLPTIPTVTITRQTTDIKETLGILRTEDGQFGCNTLELPPRNNQVNVSQIPAGKYLCKWAFKWNSLAYHYQLQNVPNRSGIFIHPGNYFFNSQGCILLGSLPQDINHDGELDLINSQAIVSAFEKKMNKQDFWLIIQ